jgi:hypothetical protein
VVRVGAYLLGLLFSGGTVLAAGSVLSSVKRSMNRPAPVRSVKAAGKWAEEAAARPALLELPSSQNVPPQSSESLQPATADSPRTGENRKKARRAEPGKRKRANTPSGGPRRQRKKQKQI